MIVLGLGSKIVASETSGILTDLSHIDRRCVCVRTGFDWTRSSTCIPLLLMCLFSCAVAFSIWDLKDLRASSPLRLRSLSAVDVAIVLQCTNLRSLSAPSGAKIRGHFTGLGTLLY